MFIYFKNMNINSDLGEKLNTKLVYVHYFQLIEHKDRKKSCVIKITVVESNIPFLCSIK
jgi:hypothetical protein